MGIEISSMNKIITITKSETIRDALKKIGLNGYKCITVVDQKNKLKGTISDGDIRRAILKKTNINSKIELIYNKKPFYLKEQFFSKKELKNYFLTKKVDIIPVVNKYNILVNVFNLKEIINEKVIKKPIKGVSVVVMAGGKGTRMKPFTNVLPKPLIPIGGITAIEKILNNLNEYGLKNCTLTINDKSQIIRAFFSEIKNKYKIKFFEEKTPLGTIGSLKMINKNHIDNDVMVTNCDIFTNFDLYDFYSFHKKNDFDVTIVASDKKYDIPYGVCEISKNGTLKNILEKPSFDFFVNVGFYLFSKKVIDIIPINKYLDVNHFIMLAKKKGFKIGIFPISDEDWSDIGQWSEFKSLKL